MKKILFFLTQSEFGGAQRYSLDLANNLKGDFTIAIALGEQGNDGKLANILHKNNIPYFVIPHLKRRISPVNDWLALFEIIKLIKSYQPDIIHLNSSKISILGSLAASLTKLSAAYRRLRVFYTVHGWVFNEPLPAGLKYFYIWAEKFTARFKNKIICVSEHDRQTALQYKVSPAEKLITIHNGLTPVDFYPKEEAKKILNLKTESLIIGSIGNLYKTKGYEYFIQAANILINQSHLPITFLIIGQGRERKNLAGLINQYNLKNNFILAGSIDNAARLLPALDIYICSSVKEGLPYSVLEAMQAGLPIISTNVGGVPEMIENNKTGLLIKPAEADDLAKKITTLLNNKALALNLCQRAKIKATTEFSLEKMVEKTKKLLLAL